MFGLGNFFVQAKSNFLSSKRHILHEEYLMSVIERDHRSKQELIDDLVYLEAIIDEQEISYAELQDLNKKLKSIRDNRSDETIK